MPARKMRVELFDSEGNRYSIAFEGQVTRDKAVRLLDLVELLGGVPSDADSKVSAGMGIEPTKYDKVCRLVQKSFPSAWFCSREVQSAYEQENKEPISISTVATYLARLSNRGLLTKAGVANNLKYRVAQAVPQATVKQQTS